MAEQIETSPPARVPRHSAPGVRRKCAECEEEDKKPHIQQKAAQASTSGARAEAPGIVHDVLHSAGEPLGAEVRTDMEQRFAHDFSQVRVHTGSRAAESAVAIGAQAYTAGPHIVFGSGKYSPNSSQGRRLLAHELTHVIQQNGGISQKPIDDLSVQCTPEAEGETPGESSGATPAASNRSQVKDTSHFVPGYEIDVAEGRAFAQEAITAMSGYGGVKVSAPPSDLVASTEAPPSNAGLVPGAKSDTTLVQTFPLGYMVQRSGGGSVKPEAGFVASIQLCYDACTGEVSVVGWFWAGGGVVTKGLLGGPGWWGAYVFVEGDIVKPTKINSLPTLKCGTCAPGCKPEDKSLDIAAGVAGFPIALKPGERASLKAAGLEVGALITPRSLCDADLEIIALLDLTKYLGPLGATVTSAEALANKLASRFGIEIECGVGVDVSGSFHLCKSVPGGGLFGITSDSARICGGGYVGCGVGLEHDKSALPGI